MVGCRIAANSQIYECFSKLIFFLSFYLNAFIPHYFTLYWFPYFYRVSSFIYWIFMLTLLIIRIKIDYYGFEFLSI